MEEGSLSINLINFKSPQYVLRYFEKTSYIYLLKRASFLSSCVSRCAMLLTHSKCIFSTFDIITGEVMKIRHARIRVACKLWYPSICLLSDLTDKIVPIIPPKLCRSLCYASNPISRIIFYYFHSCIHTYCFSLSKFLSCPVLLSSPSDSFFRIWHYRFLGREMAWKGGSPSCIHRLGGSAQLIFETLN